MLVVMIMVVVACSSQRLHLRYRYIRSKPCSLRKDSKSSAPKYLDLNCMSQVVRTESRWRHLHESGAGAP